MSDRSHIDAIDAETACINSTAAYRKSLWATVLGLVPFRDGNMWCVLYGPNIQEGMCGFGHTPDEAIIAFEMDMCEKKLIKPTSDKVSAIDTSIAP